jgi:hypothetical protein
MRGSRRFLGVIALTCSRPFPLRSQHALVSDAVDLRVSDSAMLREPSSSFEWLYVNWFSPWPLLPSVGRQYRSAPPPAHVQIGSPAFIDASAKHIP